MPVPRIDQIEVPPHDRTSRRGSRFWREWCFLRVVFRHFRIRFFIMAVILVGGAMLFMIFEPDKDHSFMHALFIHECPIAGAEITNHHGFVGEPNLTMLARNGWVRHQNIVLAFTSKSVAARV